MIKVSVLITTLNEAKNLPRCLESVKGFEEIIVIDSGSRDETIAIAQKYGACVENFKWNGKYPKKRQWCLENIDTKNNYIFFLDADEVLTPELVDEIRNVDFQSAGYFIKGQYFWKDSFLKYGIKNNKLTLFDKHKIEFPVIDDLKNFCMGEMEGHYQPVLKSEFKSEIIGQLEHSLIHYAHEDKNQWYDRHQRYAKWEAGMILGDLYPKEDNKFRNILKALFRQILFRAEIAFLHSYIGKLGVLDGIEGFEIAVSRYRYYQMVNCVLRSSKALEIRNVDDKQQSVLEK